MVRRAPGKDGEAARRRNEELAAQAAERALKVVELLEEEYPDQVPAGRVREHLGLPPHAASAEWRTLVIALEAVPCLHSRHAGREGVVFWLSGDYWHGKDADEKSRGSPGR